MDDYFDLGAFTITQLVDLAESHSPYDNSRDYKTDRIKPILAEAGFEPATWWLEARSPSWHRLHGPALADVWHKDGVTLSGRWIAVWSNVLPTRLRRPNNVQDMFTPPAGHLIVFDNDMWEHAAPRVPPEQDRWFLRCYCVGTRHA